MKIFLTGGSGYIGRATIGELVRQGHVVEALARSERAEAAVVAAGASAVRGGLTDLDVLNQAAARAEAVIHLAQATGGEPGRESGAIPYIADGGNHWALIHLDDLARLYTAALPAPAGSVYLGVGGVNPTAKEVAEACAHAAGPAGKTVSLSLAEARERISPIADAFALDQQLTPAKAQRELGWTPVHADPLTEFAAE
ncbi:NAD-dependent epimerase/dehydratase family protein [Amycolatopsis sp. CA-128772]|uniref:NAD-dependent epimerase/dehydratase family protein n=1 Tax=Amycolatopsis sp. CA-128772 TaxID=2073159 RepID=UPI000CD2582B|nr:NAD-dependent epimerase/dehydratase family protein [Amycolatopsis sp. CA-128772]